MNPASTTIGSVEDINPIGWLRRETKHLATSYVGPPPNLPCGDLLGNRDHYNKICVPLYNASIVGDWVAAQVILVEHQHLDLVGFALNHNYDTALHIATTMHMRNFVKNLVNKMTKEQLELQNKNYNTALCLAAASGDLVIANIMVDKNEALPNIPGSQGMMPLYMASLLGHHDTVHYLYNKSMKMTGHLWTDENRGWVLQRCVEADLFVTDKRDLAINGNVLTALATKTYAFQHDEFGENSSIAMPLLIFVWTRILELPKATIDDILRGPADTIRGPADLIIKPDGTQKRKHSSRVLFLAAGMGNTVFLIELIRRYPDLIWKTNDNNQTIFHVAVSHRYESIYNLLYELGSMKDMITPIKDREGNNMLHLVGKSANINRIQDISGILQMQRELLWYKEVEGMIPPSCREGKNDDGKTPQELFMEEHKDLLSTNEKLIKETANQCMVAAALIASIGFVAAFTVPGGYNQNTGIPMFLHNPFFLVFAISDAISLTFSSISILIFLSIFISRYAARDFLESLPIKLVNGLATLFFSITAMMVGFIVSFFVLYKDKLIWVPIIISILIAIPVILYIKLPYGLLSDFYPAVVGSRSIFNPKRHRLYYRNPNY